MIPNEAFSRVLIDQSLAASGWDLTDEKQVAFESRVSVGRADYILKDSHGRALCVLEAKKATSDPYDAKEQARGYAENVGAPFVILSNGTEHWFWNYQAKDSADARRVERLPSRGDLERLKLRNLQPPRPLQTEVVDREFLSSVRSGVQLRGYQIQALSVIAKQFDETRRRSFLLEMATGTGKTLLCAALIRRFLLTRNAERVLFIVDRIELARQTLEDFAAALPEFRPVIFKSARKSGELLGSSVIIATIQSLLVGRRFRQEFSPFHFDLVLNDEAHRSIYGDAREAVQYFQATRIGLTATPKAYLRNLDLEKLGRENPKALEARELRDTYAYFGCEPGHPTFRYDVSDAVQDPEGPFLCLPKILDCRTDITTRALEQTGWSVAVGEREETFKIQDLERKIFTPHRNRVMCEAFLNEAQRDPSGELGKSVVFAVNQRHATLLTKMLNELRPGVALTITSRVADASVLAKAFRDGKRTERIAVSVDMLTTGYNCPDLLNVVLMRPVFSPSEYIQIKGRGTRRFTFKIGNAEFEKRNYFLIDFCGVAEFFEEQYDYAVPLPLPSNRSAAATLGSRDQAPNIDSVSASTVAESIREIPIWEGTDSILTRDLRVVGPAGEKVDVLAFKGSFERDLREFASSDDEFGDAVEMEDDETIDEIMQERFYHRPEMFYSEEKLVASYDLPAPTPAFVYDALGKRPLPSKEQVVADTVEHLSSRYNLRYSEQKWLAAVVQLIAHNSDALADFIDGRYHSLFNRAQFRPLGGLSALVRFDRRDEVFDALRNTTLVRLSSARINNA